MNGLSITGPTGQVGTTLPLWTLSGVAEVGANYPNLARMDSVVLLGTFSGRNYAAVLMQQGLPATTYQGGGLFIADVTSLTAPTFNNSFTNVTTNSYTFGGVNSSQSMTLAGGFLYITFSGGSFVVINVTTPTAISLAGTFSITGSPTCGHRQ